jgi:hypothetical protein
MPLTTVDQGLLSTNAQYTGFKNRLINGGMVIDQRNNGASVTANDGTYAVDRTYFNMQTNSKGTGQRSTDAPPGFSNSLLYTNGSAYTVTANETYGTLQKIEGYNIADLAWGTANASSITLSFWVKSSVTGTFGGALKTGSGTAYTYAYTYTISAANTWEFKSITIPGPTVGTWDSTNGAGLSVAMGLGNGSNASIAPNSWTAANVWSATGAVSVLATAGATWQITGVQLEKGSTATSFDYRPYGTELALCQRYYWNATVSGNTQRMFIDTSTSGNRFIMLTPPSEMRANPTISLTVSSGTPNLYGGTSKIIQAYAALGNSTGNSDLSSLTASAEL